MVFSLRDYASIQENSVYVSSLNSLFSNTTVLFLGYGLRDEYVIRCIQKSSAEHPLFGTGPHFIVTSTERPELPQIVRRIRYLDEKTDHRSALLTLEAVRDAVSKPYVETLQVDPAPESVRQSLYFIGDIVPRGPVTTSWTHRVTVSTPSGAFHKQMITGEGYADGEVVLHDYSALHDIAVGLICFDIVCISIDHLETVHNLLGSETFWLLVKSGAIRLVIPPAEPALSFHDENELVGSLVLWVPASGPPSTFAPLNRLESSLILSAAERIRQQLSPAPGKEAQAEELFGLLENSLLDASNSITEDGLYEKTQGALMHPTIRELLGVGEGTPLGAVPRWLGFPILRLAGVIRRGHICQQIQASSTRMIWRSEKLASAAFSAVAGEEWADEKASYVLTGRFCSDIGSLIEKEPSLLLMILKFRETPAGEDFRREILQRLTLNDGGEIVTAINSGLDRVFPTSVLERARDQLSGLFVPRDPAPRLIPAVWGDLRNSDERISNWRKRSRGMLDQICKGRGLGPYDACPCGSGEKLKFCCRKALS